MLCPLSASDTVHSVISMLQESAARLHQRARPRQRVSAAFTLTAVADGSLSSGMFCAVIVAVSNPIRSESCGKGKYFVPYL
jgi:hypothetical protein